MDFNLGEDFHKLIQLMRGKDGTLLYTILRQSEQESVMSTRDLMQRICDESKNSKPFSARTSARLHGQHHCVKIKPYQHVDAWEKKLWDGTPYDRYVFYDIDYHKRKGYRMINILKCVKFPYRGSMHYGFVLDNSKTKEPWLFILSCHVFDRIAERRDIDRDQLSLLSTLSKEWSDGLMITKNFEDTDTILFANDGIYLSDACSIYGEQYMPFCQQFEEPAFRIIYCKTFITNEMAHRDQIKQSEEAERVTFLPHFSNYLDERHYQTAVSFESNTKPLNFLTPGFR